MSNAILVCTLLLILLLVHISVRSRTVPDLRSAVRMLRVQIRRVASMCEEAPWRTPVANRRGANTLLDAGAEDDNALDQGPMRDIEEELRENHDWFSTVFEASRDPIVVMRFSDGKLAAVNAGFCELIGFTTEDVVGTTSTELGMWESEETRVALARQLLRTGSFKNREVSFRTENGKTVVALLTARLVRVRGVQHVLAMIHDVTALREAERAAKEHGTMLAEIVDNVPNYVFWKDRSFRYLGCNANYADLMAVSRTEDVVGKTDLELGWCADDADRAIQRDKEVLEKREGSCYEEQVRLKGGRTLTFLTSKVPLKDQSDEIIGILGIATDVSQLKQVQQRNRQLSRAVNQSPASVVITDLKGTIEYVNRRFLDVTGYSYAEIVGRNRRILKPYQYTEEDYQAIWDQLESGQEWRGEFLNQKKNGELFWEAASICPLKGPDGRVTHHVAVKEDITHRKRYEQELERQAHFDALTGLPNRFFALRQLSDTLNQAADETQLVLMVLDLDEFQRINESLGHTVGDILLKSASVRVAELTRGADMLARIGGDKFLVLLSGAAVREDAESMAANIVAGFEIPFEAGGAKVCVTTSIGLTEFPTDASTPHEMLKNADLALSRAKAAGRNNCRFFESSMNDAAELRLRMESCLRSAIDEGELSLVFQPVVSARSGWVIGAEALLRWESSELGVISPAEFIPVAEESGLIVRLGEWALKNACREAKRWQERLGHPLRIAVNVSSRQFIHSCGLVEAVQDALRESGLAPGDLELEITERLILNDAPGTRESFDRLKDLGVRMSIDDFGTGYSSLSYLRRFPFNSLKIDRSFVKDVTEDPEDAALTRAIVAMARSMNLEVVGEGVETQGQLDFLVDHGCDMAQGYLFGRPAPSEQCLEIMRSLLEQAGGRGYARDWVSSPNDALFSNYGDEDPEDGGTQASTWTRVDPWIDPDPSVPPS